MTKSGKFVCGADLTFAKWLEIFDQMVDMNVRDVTITGGEPILKNDIKQIIDALVERNIFVGAFFTNGLAITNKFVDYLLSLPHPPKIYISLDGLTPLSNATIRGTSHYPEVLFNKVVETIRLLKRRGLKVYCFFATKKYRLLLELILFWARSLKQSIILKLFSFNFFMIYW